MTHDFGLMSSCSVCNPVRRVLAGTKTVQRVRDEDALYDLQGKLGLQDWDIRIGPWLEEDDGLDASVRVRTDERCATLRIAPHVTGKQRVRAIAHELVHVLLKPLTQVAYQDHSIDTLDQLADSEDIICNRIASAVTGIPWEPSTVGEKHWHAPFAEAAA